MIELVKRLHIEIKTDTHHSYNQKPHCSNKLDQRKSSNTPQNDSHVNVSSFGISGRRRTAGIEILQSSGTQDDSAERKVAENPHKDDTTTESLVIVFLFLCIGNYAHFFGRFGCECRQLDIVLCIQIASILRNTNVDFSAWFDGSGRQFFCLVISFCAPCDIVSVAKGVHVEHVGISRCKQKILNKLL